MAANPELRVKIVPVGLSYFHAHKFRSRAVVEFGSPLDVPPELVEMFSLGGTNKRDACGKLLDLIYDGLKTVTVRAPDYETLMVSILGLLFAAVHPHQNNVIPVAHSSWSTTLQEPGRALVTGPGRRIEQAVHRRIHAFPGRA